jgi:hypothetical protein
MFTKNIFPKIRIHTWGGLGSQLYAIALSYDINEKFNFRKVKFISHSSGVTKREPEIYFYSKSLTSKNDYTEQKNVKFLKLKNNVKFISKKILQFTGTFSDCNDNKSSLSIKPWVITVRGHYAGRQISLPSALEILAAVNKEFSPEITGVRNLAIHYRLGDLEVLSEKNPIHFQKLKNQINYVMQNHNSKTVFLYSDSIFLAKSRLSINGLNFVERDISALETIYECVQSNNFIGTNSKISIWIAILRATFNNDGKTYLPVEIKHMIIGENHEFPNQSIIYY